MAAKRDYYEVLGVSRSASDDEIADRYRDLALKYHPDRNPGDDDAAEKFKEAAEAFDVLSHREKRARYDRYGHAGVNGEGGAAQFHDVNDIFAAFGDVFGDLFGGGMGRRGGRRVHQGADVRCDVTVSLHEAARGAKKTVHFRRHHACTTCGGSGARPGTQRETCRYCGGVGPRRSVDRHLLDADDLPGLQGGGHDDQGPVREVPRLGLRPRRGQPRNRHPRRRRRRHAAAAAGRRRTQSRRRAAGRLLLLHLGCRASAVRARRTTLDLPGADHAIRRRPWGRRSTCPRSTAPAS